MADLEKLINEAKEAGFSDAVPLNISTLELRGDVRASCAENKCGQYGKNWTCPPACGELNELENRISDYRQGIIVQTVGELEDEFDFETTMEIFEKHQKTMIKFAKQLSERFERVLALGAGACKVCGECSYPEPCRNPKRRISSMEAYGILVSDICKKNGAEYNHGKNTQTFVGCYLIG